MRDRTVLRTSVENRKSCRSVGLHGVLRAEKWRQWDKDDRDVNNRGNWRNDGKKGRLRNRIKHGQQVFLISALSFEDSECHFRAQASYVTAFNVESYNAGLHKSEPPPNCRYQKGDMKQVPHCGHRTLRATEQNLVVRASLQPGFVHSWSNVRCH
jgi:hypothetical protein